MISNNISKSDEPTPSAGGKPQGGPNSAPREDHKYISRQWKGGKWEYEYKQEPHANRHGLAGIHMYKEHTLDLPQGISSGTHTPDQAYRMAWSHLFSQQGHTVPGLHPKTKQPVNFRIAAAGKYGPNGEVIQKPRIVAEERDVAERPGGKGSGFSGPKIKYGKTLQDMRSHQKFEKFMTEDEDSDVTDEAGNKIAEVKRVGHRNPEKLKRGYEKIKIKINPKEFGFPGDEKLVFRPDAESAQSLVATLKRNKARLAGSASAPPISAQMASGASANQIVASGTAPVVPGAKLGQVKLKFSSPEEEEAFVNKLAQENIPNLVRAQAYFLHKIQNEPKYSKIAGNDPEKLPMLFGGHDIASAHLLKPEDQARIRIDPGTPAYEGILSAASTFDPSKMKDQSRLGGYIAGGATTAAITRLFGEAKAGSLLAASRSSLGGSVANRNKMGGREGDVVVETSDSSFNEEEEAAIANLDAARGAEDRVSGDSEEGDDEEEGTYEDTVLNPWKKQQFSKIEAWANSAQGGEIKPLVGRMKEIISNLQSARDVEKYTESLTQLADHVYKDPGMNAAFKQNVLHQMKKSLEDLFNETEVFELGNLAKSAFISMVDTYDHKEGSDDHPVFYYKDSVGNYRRYTNAPEGHKDYSKLTPKPMLHYTEPSFETNPEFFTQGGQKLTRAPFPNCQVQWNPNYHENDPENLWVGRWVNPVTGQHEFTYLEKDLINQPKLKINRQNALVDARLPVFRNYIYKLFHSPQVKDHVTGLALMLMDQGRMKPSEIAALGPADVEISGDLIRLDDRVIHADTKVQMAIASLVMRSAEGPLFDAPKVSAESKFNPAYVRRIGPHYLINICMEFGVAPVALQTYQATQIYSQEVQKLLTIDNATLQVAHHFALLEVAQKMGYNMDLEPNVNLALEIIQNTLIDPVVFEAIMNNAIKLKVDQGQTQLGKTAYTSVPYVNSDLVDRTSSEKEFSDWLHNYPMHTHAEPVNLVTKSVAYSGNENFMDFHGVSIVLDPANENQGYVDFPINERVGEGIDVLVGPSDNPEFVYIVKKNILGTDQYDEDKIMFGWDSEDAAKSAFLEQFKDPKLIKSIDKMSLEKFKTEVRNHKPSKDPDWII